MDKTKECTTHWALIIGLMVLVVLLFMGYRNSNAKYTDYHYCITDCDIDKTLCVLDTKGPPYYYLTCVNYTEVANCIDYWDKCIDDCDYID